ncbi:MAG: YqgE/AlgH family protein [Actinomycetota bacterium]
MYRSLQGRLLVATPTLGDPNFARSVVLVAEHGPDGAMGLILNRPLGVTVREAVPILGEFVADGEAVHQGGPVQPEAVMALGDFVDGARAAAIAFGTVGFLPSDADETLDPATVVRARVFAGYAGWGPGQLEAELDEGSWLFADIDHRVVLETPRGGRYEAALALLGLSPELLFMRPIDA